MQITSLEVTSRWQVVRRFIKYCLTGVLNTGLSYAVYVVLVSLHTGTGVALAIGYACGMFTSYLVNARWTFGQTAWSVRTLVKFLIVNLVVLGLSELSLRLLLHDVTYNAYAAQALNLVPVTLIGFIANQRFVFGPARQLRHRPRFEGNE